MQYFFYFYAFFLFYVNVIIVILVVFLYMGYYLLVLTHSVKTGTKLNIVIQFPNTFYYKLQTSKCLTQVKENHPLLYFWYGLVQTKHTHLKRCPVTLWHPDNIFFWNTRTFLVSECVSYKQTLLSNVWRYLYKPIILHSVVMGTTWVWHRDGATPTLKILVKWWKKGLLSK